MDKKNFLVVGGSSGIGLALTQQLVETGHQVYVLSRTAEQLATLDVTHIAADVTADDLPVDQLPEVLDGIAYCPGSINLKPFRSLKPAAFRQDYEINVIGAVRVLQACLKSLKKSPSASIVFFSTVAVSQGMAYHASVAAAKGAVEGLTKSLAAELAPAIRVNCIAPSLTDTPMAAKLLSTPEKREASDQRHPLKRIGTAEEIAALAQFLLSTESTWISGQTIGIDGGMSNLRAI